MLVSKILQNLANGVKFREEYLKSLNEEFLAEKIPVITQFFDHISVRRLPLQGGEMLTGDSKFQRTGLDAGPSWRSKVMSSRKSFRICLSWCSKIWRRWLTSLRIRDTR